ncbi:MAG: PhnD/SsuA/transferrin family substrate-binding protein [Dehalococcoidia bacterium]
MTLDTRISRRRVLLSAAALGAAGLVGCSTPTEVRLGIAFGTQPLWRAIAVRKEQLEKALGAPLRFTVYESEAEVRAAFREGKLDIIAAQPSQLPQIRNDVGPVQMFLAIAWVAESLPMITSVDAPFQSIADLVGRRLSVAGLADPGFAYWRAFVLGAHQFRIEDRIELVSGIENPGPAVLNGTVDAATVTSALWASFKPTGRFRQVSDLSAAWRSAGGGQPAPIFGGYLARRGWIERNRPVVDALARVTAVAFEEYRHDPSAFVTSAAAYANGPFGPRPPAEVSAIAAYLGMDAVSLDRIVVGEPDVTAYRRIFDLMARAGAIPSAPANPDELFLALPARSSA